MSPTICHRLLVAAFRPDLVEEMAADEDVQIDHINGNPLDNRRSNLRPATKIQNQWNRGKGRPGGKEPRSPYKGVWAAGPRWAAWIVANGERTYLGQYATQEEAAIVYNEAALRLHGEFARLNQLPGWALGIEAKRLAKRIGEGSLNGVRRKPFCKFGHPMGLVGGVAMTWGCVECRRAQSLAQYYRDKRSRSSKTPTPTDGSDPGGGAR